MQAFIAKLSQEDQLFYAKVGIYTSVLTKHLPKKLVAAAETKLDN